MNLRMAEERAPSLAMDDIRSRLVRTVMTALHLKPGDLEDHSTFQTLGVGSMNAVELLEAINTEFDLRLPTSVVFGFNTIDALAGYIGEALAAVRPPSSPLRQAANREEFEEGVGIHPPKRNAGSDDVAIIGLSCRCAGAGDPSQFWKLVSAGEDAVREIQDPEWLAFIREFGGSGVPIRYGAMDDLDRFDSLFFRISPKEAERMDPCQRILLEQCHAALEDAGYAPSTLRGRHVGTFIGTMGIVPTSARDFSHFSLLGTDTSIMVSRAAYYLDLKGPALAINTACSSSLVAIDLACQQIKSGEIEMAIAGGITIYTHPEAFVSMNNSSMLSPTGRCRPFDNDADGIVVGDGVGIVILKSLNDALRDGDDIYGIIRGSGTNQDGQTSGITVPSFHAQSQLEQSVYQKNRIDVEQIQYVEAHGTATKLGDPIEVHALTDAFGKFTSKKRFCGIGSLKANFGHTTAAAGVLGLIKVLLGMKHGLMPPTVHFSQENEHIDFANSPFYVNAAAKEWTVNANGSRLAAVSSFGYSGTNAHLVVEGPESHIPKRRHAMEQASRSVLTLSAETKESLRAYAGKVRDYMHTVPEEEVADLLYTFQTARESRPHRLALIADGKQALLEQLNAFAEAIDGTDHEAIYRNVVSGHYFNVSDTEEGRDFVRSLIRQGNVRKLAELWTFGSDIDWRELHTPGSVRRMAGLPTYPFASQRFGRPQLSVALAGPRSPKAEPVLSVRTEAPQAPIRYDVDTLSAWVAELLQLPEDRIDPDRDLLDYGFDSITGMSLANRIKDRCAVAISPGELMELRSIRRIADESHSRQKRNDVILPLSKADSAQSSMPTAPSRFPLSSGQKGFWYIQQTQPESAIYNIPSVFRIRQTIDPAALEEACRDLLRRHLPLRSLIADDGSEPEHQVVSPERFRLDMESIEGLNDDEIQGKLDGFIRVPFELARDLPIRVRLFSVSPRDHFLAIVVHHIAFDGSSTLVLIREILGGYASRLDPHLPEPMPLAATYADYVTRQNLLLEGEDGSRLKAYWKKKLEGAESSLQWPSFSPEEEQARGAACRMVDKEASAEWTERVEGASRRHRVSPFVFLLSAFYALLYRYTNQEDIVVGTAVENRPEEKFKNLIGNFINLLPIRSRVTGETNFAGLLADLNGVVREALEHAAYPYAEIVRMLQAARAGGDTLDSNASAVQAGFIYQNWFKSESQIVGDGGDAGYTDALRLEYVDSFKQQSDFELSLEVIKRDGRFRMCLKYDPGRISRATAQRMIDHYAELLGAASEAPDRQVGELELLTAEERKLMERWNATDAEFPGEACIQQLFEEQAAKHPDHIALISGAHTMTYGELNRRSNQLARFLRRQGLKPNETVGLFAERSMDMVIGLFGILKAGGAFVPIDPDYPEDRIRYMLDNSQVRILLTQHPSLLRFRPDMNVVSLSDGSLFAGDDSNLDYVNKPDDLVYVIYTSGSTGKPKGVMIEHRSLVNRLKWTRKAYPMSADDTLMQKTPFTFDCSVWELFCWSIEGAKLCLLPPRAERDPQAIIGEIVRNNVTLIHFVPSMLNLFLDYVKGSPSLKSLGSLRRVFTTGEPLTVQHVRLFNETLHSQHGTRLTNLYGPTETTIEVSYYDCPTDGEFNKIPIGKPIDNLRLYVLNRFDKLQPIGVTGELCIAGVGVGRGYINNRELTEAKFVSDPFREGGRMYRTGDLARLLPDGNVEYVGRTDRQVKIRGYRMELGEIEAALLEFDSVREACVVVDQAKDLTGSARLTAYISAFGNSRVNEAELRSFLRTKLPEYMIPAAFAQLDSIPLTAHGKADFAALAANGRSPNVTASEPPAGIGLRHSAQAAFADTALLADSVPQTDVPQRDPIDSGDTRPDVKALITSIYAELLQRDDIDPDVNFFDLGGHSMLLVKAAIRLRDTLGKEVPPAQLLQYPTVNALAGYLEKSANQPGQLADRQRRAAGLRELFSKASRASLTRK